MATSRWLKDTILTDHIYKSRVHLFWQQAQTDLPLERLHVNVTELAKQIHLTFLKL